MIGPYFYSNWILGSIFIILFSIYLIKNRLFDKAISKTLFFSIIWIIVPLFSGLTGKIVNTLDNFKHMLLFVFYILVSMCIVYMFISVKNKTRFTILFYTN